MEREKPKFKKYENNNVYDTKIKNTFNPFSFDDETKTDEENEIARQERIEEMTMLIDKLKNLSDEEIKDWRKRASGLMHNFFKIMNEMNFKRNINPDDDEDI